MSAILRVRLPNDALSFSTGTHVDDVVLRPLMWRRKIRSDVRAQSLFGIPTVIVTDVAVGALSAKTL